MIEKKVAVGYRHVKGVGAPGSSLIVSEMVDGKIEKVRKSFTFNWRERPGSAGNTRGVKAAYKVDDWRTAFWKHYDFDAHCPIYLVHGPDGEVLQYQPRVNKDGLDYVESDGSRVMAHMIGVDVDLPNHKSWDDLTIAERQQQNESIQIAMRMFWLRGALFYVTMKGWRVIIPIEPISVRIVEAYIHTILRLMQEAGVQGVDMKCADWTRIFRMPFVKREDKFDSTWSPEQLKQVMDARNEANKRLCRILTEPDDIEIVPLPQPEEGIKERIRKTGKIRSRGVPVTKFVAKEDVPKWMIDAARRVGEIIKVGNQNGLHNAYLAMSAMLCSQGIAASLAPSVVWHICDTATSRAPDVNISGCERTCLRWEDGLPVIGEMWLCNNGFKYIYQAIYENLGRYRSAQAPSEAPVEMHSYEEAQELLQNTVSSVEEGCTILQVSPGAGKTTKFLEEAARLSVGDGNEKVGISVDTNALSIQVFNDALDKGADVARLYGPTSVQGAGECAYKEQAKHIASGGQSVFAVGCLGLGGKPCDKFDTCTAKTRVDGDINSPMLVGTHGNLNQIMEKIGRGLLAVDEPRNPVDSISFTMREVYEALGHHGRDMFKKDFITAIRPAAGALYGWFAHLAVEKQHVDLYDAINAAYDAIDNEEMLAAKRVTGIEQAPDLSLMAIRAAALSCEADAEDDDTNRQQTRRAPPFRKEIVGRLFAQTSYAKFAGRTSKFYDTLRRACRAVLDGRPAKVCFVETNAGPSIEFTLLNETIIDVITRDAPTLALDATAQRLIAASRIAAGKNGRALNVVKINLKDYHPVKRVHLNANASRSVMFDSSGGICWDGMLTQMLEKVSEMLDANKTEHPAFVCPLSLRIAMQYTFNVKSPDIIDPERAWLARGRSIRDLADAARRLRKIFPREMRWVLYHFGAERGRNDGRECDAIVTFGDPRPNIDTASREAAILSIDTDEYIRTMAADALTQAHGRLRHVSPYRPAPEGKSLLAIHVGKILPSEPQWHSKDVEVDFFIPKRGWTGDSMMSNDDFCLLLESSGLSQAEVAELLGITTRTVSRWVNSKSSIRRTDALLIRKNVRMTMLLPDEYNPEPDPDFALEPPPADIDTSDEYFEPPDMAFVRHFTETEDAWGCDPPPDDLAD